MFVFYFNPHISAGNSSAYLKMIVKRDSSLKHSFKGSTKDKGILFKTTLSLQGDKV